MRETIVDPAGLNRMRDQTLRIGPDPINTGFFVYLSKLGPVLLTHVHMDKYTRGACHVPILQSDLRDIRTYFKILHNGLRPNGKVKQQRGATILFTYAYIISLRHPFVVWPCRLNGTLETEQIGSFHVS